VWSTQEDSLKDIKDGFQTRGLGDSVLNVVLVDDILDSKNHQNESGRSVLVYIEALRKRPQVGLVPTVVVIPNVYHRRLFILRKNTRTYTLGEPRRPWSTADKFLRSQFDVQNQLRVLPVDEVIRRAVDFGVDLRALAHDNYRNCLTVHTVADAADLVVDLDCLGGRHRELTSAIHAQLLPRVFCKPYAEPEFGQRTRRRPRRTPLLPRRQLVLLSMLTEGTGGRVAATLDKLSYLGPRSGHSRVLPHLVDVMRRSGADNSVATYRAWVTKLQHGFFRNMRAKNSPGRPQKDTKRKKKEKGA
jgi:hypothetical protein